MMSIFQLALLLCALAMINSEKLRIFPSEKTQKMRKVRDLLSMQMIGLCIRGITDERLQIDIAMGAKVSDIYVQMGLKECLWDFLLGQEKLPIGNTLADSGIGPQTTIELKPSSYTRQILGAFADTNLKEILESEERDLSDTCSWKEVTCNDQNIPIVLDITAEDYGQLHGNSIDFGCFPSTLKSIKLSRIGISSAVHFSQLPRSLESLELHFNGFTGIGNFNHMPTTLKHVFLRNNQFSGIMNYSNLPSNLEILILHRISFDGNLIINGPLPLHLRSIELYEIPFNGNVNLQGMKNRLVELNIDIESATKPFQRKFHAEMNKNNIETQCSFIFM